MVSPQTRGKMKNVFGFFFFPPSTVGRKRDETHPQTNTLSSLCMSYKRSLTRNNPENSAHTHVICLLLWIRHTHTPTLCYAAVLTDGPRGGPHLPKCRCWTDCGGVMNGWSRLSRGAEETISAMLISPLLLRPASIPHPPVLLLWFSRALSQSITVSLSPSHQPDQFAVSLSLSPCCTIIAISINMHLWGRGINE